MAVINIALPFLLITWAERNVESALAAILTSIVPLFVAVLAPLFIHDEPMRMNAIVGLGVGFIGVVVLTSRGLTGTESHVESDLALIGSSLSYAAGAVYARRNVRGIPPMIPAVFQVSFAFIITGAIALLFERPWEARPDPVAVGSIIWLGLLGSGAAFLAFFRLLDRWGATRTAAVAYVLPVVGIVLGFLVLQEPIDGRMIFGTALIIVGLALVNNRVGRDLLSVRRPSRATNSYPRIARVADRRGNEPPAGT
jgi:drug/metabolite transporter (DMT)-like permease